VATTARTRHRLTRETVANTAPARARPDAQRTAPGFRTPPPRQTGRVRPRRPPCRAKSATGRGAHRVRAVFGRVRGGRGAAPRAVLFRFTK
jgi:hypothetical protein